MFSFLKNSNTKKDMNISPEEFPELFQKTPGVVIDVRTPEEYEQGYLAAAEFLFDWRGGEFQDAMKDLDKEETYYLYCRTGNRSGQAAELMRENGFEKVYNIGGFQDLSAAGMETESKE